MAEKKRDTLTKAKMVYSGELLLFTVVFLTLGILILVGVIAIKEWKRIAFSYVTLIGGAWIVADFIWTLCSKKRRAKKCLLDKCLVLPAGLALIAFDIYAFAAGLVHADETAPIFQYMIGADLCYLSIVYCFEAFYHWKYPLPEILAAVEEEKKQAELEALKAKQTAESETPAEPAEKPENNAEPEDLEK